MYKRKKIFFVTALLIIMSLFVVSCSSSSRNGSITQSHSAPAASSEEKKDYYDGIGDSGAPVPQPSTGAISDEQEQGLSGSAPTEDLRQNRKLIMDGNVSLETHDFEASVQDMDNLIEKIGGFAESRTVRGKSNYSRALRSAAYVIRVPAEKFDVIMEDIGSIGTVLETNSKGTDITDQYFDSEARIKNLKVQEQTLLDILAKATELEDVITLETRLSDLRYQIESIENTLKNYDRLIAFSRINIYVQEVDDVTETRLVEKKLGERISSAFSHSLKQFRIGVENFLVWFAESWITLVFLGIIVAILLKVIRKNNRKKKIFYSQEEPETHNENDEQK